MEAIQMIKTIFDEAVTEEWINANINNQNHELVILREIIPWERIIRRLSGFYHKTKGAFGKSLRSMVSLEIMIMHYLLSDRKVIKQVKENRYIQFFCNIPDEGLQTFLHPSTLCVFRMRIGKEGAEIIENEVFEVLRRAGIIRGDNALIDSTVLENNIIYPNDVLLIFKAFKKMQSYADQQEIPVWWDHELVKSIWREFGLNKEKNRSVWLIKFNELFIPALEIFKSKIESVQMPEKRESKVQKLLSLLILLEEQTLEKLSGEKQIKNRIVSLDEPDARPIKKGKRHPECEFGSTVQMSFNREGFMITAENFIGNPNDKTLYGDTLNLFQKRMKQYPDTVITDLGYRSRNNFEITPEDVGHVFLGRSEDTAEEKRDFCRRARSATEGFIAVAKNLRGFGCSLYRGFKGDRIWTLLCQTVYNLKKFIQIYFAEKIEEKSLIKLGLLT